MHLLLLSWNASHLSLKAASAISIVRKGIFLRSIPTDSLPSLYPDKSYFVHWWLLVEKHHSNTLAHPHSWIISPRGPYTKGFNSKTCHFLKSPHPLRVRSPGYHCPCILLRRISSIWIFWLFYSGCEWDRTTLQWWRLLLDTWSVSQGIMLLPPACCRRSVYPYPDH
jgi:hypothetical protein